MAGEKDFDSTTLTFWLVFIVGMVLVMGLYRGFMGPLTAKKIPKQKLRSRKGPPKKIKGHMGHPVETSRCKKDDNRVRCVCERPIVHTHCLS